VEAIGRQWVWRETPFSRRRGFTQSSRNLHSGFRAGFYPLERNDQFHLEGKSEAFNVSDAWKVVFDGNLSFIQAQFVWLIVIALACWYILERTRLGNHLFASGGNSVAAKAAGVNVDRTKVIAFMITGFLAAFSGIVSTVRVTTVSPVQGEGIELEAIAAWSSSAGESHPHALTEPDVSLSTHPALIVQPSARDPSASG